MFSFFKKYKNMDMLHGSLWDKLFIFSMPLALTGILQQLFNIADVAVLGRYVGNEAVAAVGNNIPVIGLVVNLLVGVSIGANVVVARYLGMKDEKNANEAVNSSLTLALMFGVVIAILGLLIAPYAMEVLGVPPEVKDRACLYLQIYILGMPFMACYNFEAALFRSKGDTNTPLIALLIASTFNVIANYLVVAVFNFEEGAVAFTTVLSNLLCAGFLFYKLTKETGFLHVSLKFKLPNRRKTRAIISVGLPAGIQGMVFSLSNLVIQSAINSLGTDVMAASAAAFSVEVLVYSIVNSYGLAATTFVSQNYGAKNLARCRQVTRTCVLMDFLSTLAIVLVVACFKRELLGFFTDSEVVIELALIRVFYVTMTQPMNCFMEIYSGSMRGFGYSLPPAIVTLFCICGMRLIYIYTYFQTAPTYEHLMVIYPASWLFTTICLIILYIYHQKQLAKKLNEE